MDSTQAESSQISFSGLRGKDRPRLLWRPGAPGALLLSRGCCGKQAREAALLLGKTSRDKDKCVDGDPARQTHTGRHHSSKQEVAFELRPEETVRVFKITLFSVRKSNPCPFFDFGKIDRK